MIREENDNKKYDVFEAFIFFVVRTTFVCHIRFYYINSTEINFVKII